MPQQTLCPACDGTMGADGAWRMRCRACGFLSSTLEPGVGRGVAGLDDLRRANFRLLCDRLEAHCALQGAKVLEVGCGKGLFACEALLRGGHVTAVEPYPERDLLDLAGNRAVELVCSRFDEARFDAASFDVIAFNDSFEHLPDIRGALARCHALLAPGGLLIINLPSSRGVFYRCAGLLEAAGIAEPMRRLWQAGMPSPHLSYFSPGNLALFVERQSAMREVARFSLPSVARAGMRERLDASMPRAAALPVAALLTAMLPLVALLPPDITVGIFRKSPTALS